MKTERNSRTNNRSVANKPTTVAVRDTESEEIKPIEVQQKPRFANDPKLQKKIKIGKPLFKREVRIDQARAGYLKLLSKLNESEMCIRQIKNGQTLFDQEVMRTKYANPYFKNG